MQIEDTNIYTFKDISLDINKYKKTINISSPKL